MALVETAPCHVKTRHEEQRSDPREELTHEATSVSFTFVGVTARNLSMDKYDDPA